MGTLDKGMVHIPGGTEHDSTRLHHTTPNGMPFKTYDLFIAVIFHLLFSEHSWLQVTEIVESKTVNKGDSWDYYSSRPHWLLVVKVLFLQGKKTISYNPQ